MRHKIQIKPLDEFGHCEVYVNDKQLCGVTSIQTSHDVNEPPYVCITVLPERADIETLATLDMKVDVDSVQTAIGCIQFALRLDDDLKNGVLFGIDDVLHTELGEYKPGLAEKIMNRVFGLD